MYPVPLDRFLNIRDPRCPGPKCTGGAWSNVPLSLHDSTGVNRLIATRVEVHDSQSHDFKTRCSAIVNR